MELESVQPEVGKTYIVDHSFYGRFVMAVTEIVEEKLMVTGTVVEQISTLLGYGSAGEPGDTITTSLLLCRFTPHGKVVV